MLRRDFILGGAASFLTRGQELGLTRIGFGSCADQTQPQPIWKEVARHRPDLFIFLGDNIYGDTDDVAVLRQKYLSLAQCVDFSQFRKRTPLLATWDDHDYGFNDSGEENRIKRESKELFLDFFKEPRSSLRWRRDGIYTSVFYGNPPFRTQIILLDLRWFRSSPGAMGTLLGENQWRWLERELTRPADLRILASSIQFAAEGHNWEKWANFPNEKQRLLSLIDKMPSPNLFVISGDMHFGELSSLRTAKGVEIFDLTSSGLNRWEPADGSNLNRLQIFDQGVNFGLIEIDWKKREIDLSIRTEDGRPVIRVTAAVDRLSSPQKLSAAR